MNPASGWRRGIRQLPTAEPEPQQQDPEDGQALIEYAFTLMFVALVAITGLRALGPKVSDLIATVTF